MAKHKKKSTTNARYEKSDNIIALKLLITATCAGLYFYLICFLNRLVYNNCLFFLPKASVIMAGIGAVIVLFSAFFIGKKTVKLIKSHKYKSTIIAIFTCIFLVLPIFMFKSGTVADSNSIRKYNVFGKVINEYSYSDIETFNCSTHKGVTQYDIEFKSGDTIFIRAYDIAPIDNFYTNENLMKFDQILAKNGIRTVDDPVFTLPDYTRRFIKDDEVFEYFDNIFSE